MVSQEIGTSGHSSIGPSGHSQSVKSTGSRVGLGNRNSQRESIFGRARASFVRWVHSLSLEWHYPLTIVHKQILIQFRNNIRSGGDRGATLATLRGTRGADFEAKGEVQRVHPDALGGCFCFGKNSGTVSSDRRYVFLCRKYRHHPEISVCTNAMMFVDAMKGFGCCYFDQRSLLLYL